MSHSLKTDPNKIRDWQNRSRKRMVTRAPLKCRSRMKRGARIKSYRPAAEGSIKDLERKLDELTRRVLRQDERVCFTDGKRGTATDPLTLSHLFGRAQRPTRFDCHTEGNNHLQHASCNQAHNEDKSIYRDEYIRRFGQSAYDDLDRRAHCGNKWTPVELSEMILKREAMLV